MNLEWIVFRIDESRMNRIDWVDESRMVRIQGLMNIECMYRVQRISESRKKRIQRLMNLEWIGFKDW